jgi:hypothetical protein
MKITWVNHASFVLESGPIRLLTDPWLEGTAFNDSWELLVPSRFEMKDFDQMTHIWFSHEHPDHFAPPVLSKIPRETRKRITVLYQETRDHRVIDFCTELGFKTRELRDGETTDLSDDFHVTCGKVPFYDSWLACEAEGLKILDFNDCIMERRKSLRNLRERFGFIDLLLAQCSYASWYGNADQPERWHKAASRMMDQLLTEIAEVKPRFTIPCASFVRFCHAENQHMNTYINRIDNVTAKIAEQQVSVPVVLFPGEQWTVGAAHDNGPALSLYKAAEESHCQPRTSQSVSLDEITSLAEQYCQRMLAKNNALLVRLATYVHLLPQVVFHLSDIDMNLGFDWTHELRPISQGVHSDITLHSDSLAYLFRFDWGLDTLQVGGRFQADKAGFRKLLRTFCLGSLNNIGRRFGPGLAIDPYFVQRTVTKLIRAH